MPRTYTPQKELNADLSPTFLAWAAGFIDGEGCIRAATTRNDNRGAKATATTTRLRLSVSQKPREALDLLRDTFGVGLVKQQHGTTPRGAPSVIHVYDVNCRQAEQVLHAVMPYLVVKRQDAIDALNATYPPCAGRF